MVNKVDVNLWKLTAVRISAFSLNYEL